MNKEVNFCEMDEDHLMKILKFLDVFTNIVEKVELPVIKMQGGKVIEKEWNYYDIVTVTPKSIICDHRNEIFTAEKYQIISEIFQTPTIGELREEIISYIQHDAEIAIPVERFFDINGNHITKKEYGHVLLGILCDELREKFL